MIMSENNKTVEEILDDYLVCSQCADIGTLSARPKSAYGLVEYYMEVLPGIVYVRNQLVDYIFSNGLTTGITNDDKTLSEFLYRTNAQGVTNYSVLRDAIGTAATHGECGIRWYEDNIYLYKPNYYKALTDITDGIETVVAYYCREDGEMMSSDDIDLSEVGLETIVRDFESQGYIYLDKTDFVNVRNDTSMLHGESPLLKDKLRLDLLVTTYEQLNKDLKYNGPGRIILRPKDGYVSDDTNEISTSSVMNQSAVASAKREERAKAEINRIGKQIKESTPDQVIMLSNAFSDNIKELPKQTKATEFLEWIDKEGAILSQILGMSPSLLELGDVSGNVSMERIIDNAMLNTIVPMREQYAIQFSPLLAQHMGFKKVYFNKYDLQQAEDRNTTRTKIANIMTLLNSIETEEAQKLVKDFGQMLDDDIHNDNGELKELAVGRKENEHEFITDIEGRRTGRSSGRKRRS